MAKKPPVPAIPEECCGVCAYARSIDKDLVCYVDPPSLIPDEEGVITAARGVEVFPQDPICKNFKPRIHA